MYERTEKIMYCTNCGTRNEDDSRFCVNCGHRLIPVSEHAGAGNTSGGQTQQASNLEYTTQIEFTGQVEYQEADTSGNAGGAGSGAGSGRNTQQTQSAAASSSCAVGTLYLLARIAAFVVAVVFAYRVIQNILSVFTLFGLLTWKPLYFLFLEAENLLELAARVIVAAALILFGVRLDPAKKNGEILLLTVAGGGMIRIAVHVVNMILALLANLICWGYLYIGIFGMLKGVLATVVAVAIPAVFLFLTDSKPFAGKSKAQIMDEIRDLPAFLQEQL